MHKIEHRHLGNTGHMLASAIDEVDRAASEVGLVLEGSPHGGEERQKAQTEYDALMVTKKDLTNIKDRLGRWYMDAPPLTTGKR